MTKNATPVTPPDQSTPVQPTIPNSNTAIPAEIKKKVFTRTTEYPGHNEDVFKK